MNTYEVNIMAQKAGKDPARLGYYEVEATSEQRALELATAAGKKHYYNACKTAGIQPDNGTRIFAELAQGGIA